MIFRKSYFDYILSCNTQLDKESQLHLELFSLNGIFHQKENQRLMKTLILQQRLVVSLVSLL